MTSNNLFDASILDITSSSDDVIILSDDHPSIEIPSTNNTIRVPAISGFRLTNILRLLVFVEFLVLLIIWLAGRSLCFLLLEPTLIQ
jgi:hypothetical protein